MKKMFLSAFAVAALAFVGCTEDATNDLAQENGGAAVELHEMTFEAEIEQPTRTSLADPGTGTSYVCWDADDVVGVVADDGEIYQATIKSGAGTAWATYSVALPVGVSPAVAFYPYQFARETKSGVSVEGDVLNLTLPSIQTYKAGSVFGDDENFMAAYFADGANGPKCTLKSVMGALELKFKGSQKVEAITVKASKGSQKLSGLATVNPETKALTMNTSVNAYSFVSLEVPEAVTLNSSKTTSFYVLVPAGTYEALQIGVMTEDGSYARTATKTHTVKVGEILPINCGNLDTMIDEGAADNLSANGYANCYVVVPNGSEKTYVFDTKYVDGTTITARTFHTKTYTNVGDAADPHMAQILWTEDTNVAYDIQFDKANGKIYFKNNGTALGNARIILTCDQINLKTTTPANQLVWAWHIWSTPSTPETCIALSSTAVTNNTTTAAQLAAAAKSGMMDRNLGATWTAKTVAAFKEMTATQAADALGLYYQAGNVHPLARPATFGDTSTGWKFARAKYQYGFSTYTQSWSNSSSAKTSLEEHLQHPYYRYSAGYTPSDTYTTGSTTRNSWIKIDFRIGGTKGSGDADVPILWSNDFKTNYDPCPPGWRIPHQGNLYHFLAGEKRIIAGKEAEGSQRVVGLFATTIGDGTNYYGQYVSFNGTDAYFIPGGGYNNGSAITYNYNNSIGYYWASPYGSTTYKDSGATKLYNIGTKGQIYVDPYTNASSNTWPQAGSPYQIRCIKK